MQQANVTIVPPDGSNTVSVFGIQVDVLVTAQETGGAYSTYRVTVQPGDGSPPHIHHKDDEGFYVLEGEFEFLCGDRMTTATEGAFVHLPRNIPHYFRNVGTGTGRLLGIGTPAGHEKFFEDIGRLSADGPPDMEEAMAISRKHGIEILLSAPAATT